MIIFLIHWGRKIEHIRIHQELFGFQRAAGHVTTREDPGNKVNNMAPGKGHVNSRTSKKFLQGSMKSSSGVKKSNTSKMCKKKVWFFLF